MTTATLFAIVLIVAAAAVAIVSYVQYGRVRGWKDWVPAMLAALVIASILAVTARAQSFAYTEVFFGLELPDTNGHPACMQGDNQLTSNVGINQNLYLYRSGPASLAIDGTYRHHSCAIGDDDRVTDTLGVNAVFRVEWW